MLQVGVYTDQDTRNGLRIREGSVRYTNNKARINFSEPYADCVRT